MSQQYKNDSNNDAHTSALSDLVSRYVVDEEPEPVPTMKELAEQASVKAQLMEASNARSFSMTAQARDFDLGLGTEANEDDNEGFSLETEAETISIDDNSESADSEEEIEEVSVLAEVDDEQNDAEFLREQSSSKVYSSLLTGYDPEEEALMDSQEDLLDECNDRLVLKPINPKYKPLFDLYKKQVEAFWTPEKIDFSRDKHDFVKLNEGTQKFIKKILAFFAGADSVVNINIDEQFSRIKVKEANIAYQFQEAMENIHSEVYSDMLDNIITDAQEKEELINAFKTVESIRDMIGWGKSWIDSNRRIGFSIMSFTIFEGLMFSGAFAAIYWLKDKLGDDKMQGLIGSNEFIARDEGMHTNFGCLIYDYVQNRLTAEEAETMMREAVQITQGFIIDALDVGLIGMNKDLMNQYIEYVADRLMVYLGYEKIYNSKMPAAFSFMEQIGILNKNNFFERRTSEYQLAHNQDNTADWQFRIIEEY